MREYSTDQQMISKGVMMSLQLVQAPSTVSIAHCIVHRQHHTPLLLTDISKYSMPEGMLTHPRAAHTHLAETALHIPS